MNRILKRIAIYTQELGNSRRSGSPLGAEHIKSKHNSNRWDPREIQKYIEQYEIEIKQIEKQLQYDPYNQKLLMQLEDKKKRKKEFEKDLEIEDYSFYSENESDKSSNNNSRLQKSKINKEEQEKRKQEKREQIETTTQKLIIYIQDLKNNPNIYESLINKQYRIFDKRDLQVQIAKALREFCIDSCRDYLYSLDLTMRELNSIIRNCNELIDNNINFNELANKYIKENIIIISDINELINFLDTHNLLDSIKQYIINNNLNGNFNKVKLLSSLCHKICEEWYDNQLGILNYNEEHNNTKTIVPINFSNQELTAIAKYMIDKDNLIEYIKTLRKENRKINKF